MADGVVLMVESNKDCHDVGRGVIRRVSQRGLPLLILANKQEGTGHMTAMEIVEILGLNAMKDHPWCKYSRIWRTQM